MPHHIFKWREADKEGLTRSNAKISGSWHSPSDQARKSQTRSKTSFAPVEGTVILFPAWLAHEVGANMSEAAGRAGDLFSISFNIAQRQEYTIRHADHQNQPSGTGIGRFSPRRPFQFIALFVKKINYVPSARLLRCQEAGIRAPMDAAC